MKKLIIAFCTITLISTVVFTSCSKYPDGPKISLRSKKARLAGDWKIDKATYNDEDITEDLKDGWGANFVLHIDKGGKYTATGNDPDTGKWELGEDKDDVRFQSDEPNSKEESYKILRLANKELWLKQTQPSGDIFIIHYKQ
jgi:hypothetical protein